MFAIGARHVRNANNRKFRGTIAYCQRPEAISLKDIEASTICRAFCEHWVSRYGSTETLTTDQGSQFESQLFSARLQLIGCNPIQTTAYHPESNA